MTMLLAPQRSQRTAPATLPRITVVTATLNQAPYLEQTLRSVLEQDYPNLEYIVVDGGSTDGSAEIIRRCASRLARWTSEPDRGHGDALNKGFAHATGEVMGWINGDDVLTPWSLRIAGEVFAQLGDGVQWLTGLPAGMLADGRVVGVGAQRGYNRTLLRLGMYEGRKLGWVQQEGTFWSRDLWERAGGRIDPALRVLPDYDLWTRFAALAPLYTVPTVMGIFRHRPGQISSLGTGTLGAAADQVQARLPGRITRRLLPVRVLRYLERQGLRLSRDFVRYDFERQRWVVAA